MDYNTPDWAAKKNYYHHSNPVASDAKTIWDKGFVRVRVNKAYAILKGETDGDTQLAKATIDKYKILNTKMHAGIVVQEACDSHLLNDVSMNEVLKNAKQRLQEYESPTWRDQEKEKIEIEYKLESIFAQKEIKGEMTWRKADEGTHTELELVINHAIEGLKAAQKEHGLNRLEGEVDLYAKLPKCELLYNGKPDYSQRIELKTIWTSNVVDKPRSNSLPSEIRSPHMTQIAGYYFLTKKLPTIVYANKSGYRMFSPTEDQLQDALQIIIESCQRRERLLKAADNIEDVLRLCDPQWNGLFGWNDMNPEVLKNAKKIWRIE